MKVSKALQAKQMVHRGSALSKESPDSSVVVLPWKGSWLK